MRLECTNIGMVLLVAVELQNMVKKCNAELFEEVDCFLFSDRSNPASHRIRINHNVGFDSKGV